MSVRYQSFTQLDTRGFIGGDDRWIGIDSTHDRDKAQAGMLYRGENTRLRTGTVRQRLGTTIPADLNPVGGFANTIVGSGMFRDPDGREIMLIAPREATYTIAVAPDRDPYQIDYSGAINPPTGNNGTVLVDFVQAYDKVQMFRIGPGQNVVWNGNDPSVGDVNCWQKTTLSTDGKDLVPVAVAGEPWGDRVITYTPLITAVPYRDTWYVSDLFDYTSYDKAYQTMRTNAADSDIITSIKAFMRGSAVIYKDKSIHLATDNFTFPFSAIQRKLSDIGAIGIHMPLDVGGDQIFLSQPNGFYRLREVIQENIIALPRPISEPIQRVVDQINWYYTAILGCSAALDNYAFFAVCLGSAAQRLNCILVYNTQNNQWESAGDTWRDTNFAFNRLHVVNFGGYKRLCAVDYVEGIVYLLYEGVHDELRSGTFSVPFKMESRGYIGDDPLQFKRFGRARVSIASWDPEITINAIMDGVNEEFLLTENPITKDNATFYTHGLPAFDPALGDANAPYREDYSVADFDDSAIETFEALPVGVITFVPATAPFKTVGDLQECTESLMVRQIGRWGALRVENNEGFVEVKALTMEGIPGVNAIKTAA